MNFCFLARPDLDELSPKLFLEIKKTYDKDANGYFVTTNHKESSVVKSFYSDAITFETSTYLKEHWNEFSEDKLGYFEKKYECAPIWKYIYIDRFLINRDYNYVVKITVGLFSFFENIFKKYKIDYYYSETIATLQCYIAYLVGKKTNTKYYGHMLARELDNTHHFVFNDPYQNICGFNNNYLTIEYSEKEIKQASKFLDDFEKNMIKPSFVNVQRVKPKIKLKDITIPIKYIKNFFNKSLNEKFSYMYYKSYSSVWNPIVYYFRYKKCKKYYTLADYTRKYIYFPLHYQPEASTLVCAEKYEKQLYYIDSIAKSLPADTVLYVKEHFAKLGNRDENFYKELKKYPNVILIDPFEDSKTIIKESSAVVTLTGTAGFEAMLLRKPVFVAGNVFYSNAPGIINIDDIYQNIINKLNEWKQPSRMEIIKYLCEYFKSIYPGIQYGTEKCTREGNILLLAKSLVEVIKNEKK